MGSLDPIDCYDPTQRAKIANHLVRRLSTKFKVRTVRIKADYLSFAR